MPDAVKISEWRVNMNFTLDKNSRKISLRGYTYVTKIDFSANNRFAHCIAIYICASQRRYVAFLSGVSSKYVAASAAAADLWLGRFRSNMQNDVAPSIGNYERRVLLCLDYDVPPLWIFLREVFQKLSLAPANHEDLNWKELKALPSAMSRSPFF